MSEPVRLVIWDLDDTFWQGTLSEGGIIASANGQLVAELARRGIVSTICSKNDFSAVESALREQNVWDYFVMPSVDWSPKGPRIAALIGAFQLRPATVMFIDDNPLNLEEARHFSPGLQVRLNTFVPEILDSTLFKGKSDLNLLRLKQYKMLERRKADEVVTGDNAEAFLRSSEIKVRFDYEIAGDEKLGRAVEIINRTNQLNFTKKRLSEDLEAARDELRQELSSHQVRAALVGVRDKYGDHGWCGFYLQHNNGSLLHFAFSCRVLGMMIERWLYRRLGTPSLTVVGEVLTDIHAVGPDVDWVTIDGGTSSDADHSPLPIQNLVARGGCDLMPLVHYLMNSSQSVVGEFNENRFGMDGRIDHSAFLAAAVSGIMTEHSITAAEKLGYRASDFQSAVTSFRSDTDVWLFSFWTDAAYTLYRHRTHGFSVPFSLSGYHTRNACDADIETLRSSETRSEMLTALEALKAEYDYIGFVDEATFKDNLRSILEAADNKVKIYIVTPNEYFVRSDDTSYVMKPQCQQNLWTEEVARHYGNVRLFNIRDFVIKEQEVHTPYHFDRTVYFRLFQAIHRDIVETDQSHVYRGWALHETDDLSKVLNSKLSADACARTAKFLINSGNAGAAVSFGLQAVKEAPDINSHRVVLLEALEASDVAKVEDIELALDSNGLSASAFHRAGNLLLKLSRFNDAAIAFAAAAERAPQDFAHRHRQGNALDRAGRQKEACDVLRGCLIDGDENKHVLAHVVRLLIQLQSFKEAEKLVDQGLVAEPDFPPLNAAKALLEEAMDAARSSAL